MSSVDAHEGVWHARVIDEFPLVATLRGVGCHSIAGFDNRDAFTPPGTPPGFALADALSRQFSDLPPCRNTTACVEAQSVDPAWSDFKQI